MFTAKAAALGNALVSQCTATPSPGIQFLAVQVDYDETAPDIGSTIDLYGHGIWLGLPPRDFELTVCGHYQEPPTSGSDPGFFVALNASTWKDEDEAMWARRRGLWHSPPASKTARECFVKGCYPPVPQDVGHDGGGVTDFMRLYLADQRAQTHPEVVEKIRNEYRETAIELLGPPLGDGPALNPFELEVIPWTTEWEGWTALDFAVDMAHHQNPLLFNDLFFIADQQSFDEGGGSVVAVVQLDQLPERKDPIRTVRYTPKAMAELTLGYPEDRYRIVTWELDPGHTVTHRDILPGEAPGEDPQEDDEGRQSGAGRMKTFNRDATDNRSDLVCDGPL